MQPVVFVVLQSPARWRSTNGFFHLSLLVRLENKATKQNIMSEYLEQAEHARAERNRGTSDDAFADATNVIASAASASECSMHTSTISEITGGFEPQGADL